jgi:hypothetical protein
MASAALLQNEFLQVTVCALFPVRYAQKSTQPQLALAELLTSVPTGGGCREEGVSAKTHMIHVQIAGFFDHDAEVHISESQGCMILFVGGVTSFVRLETAA